MGNSNASTQQSQKYSITRTEQNQLLSHLSFVQQQTTGTRLVVKQLAFANQLQYQRVMKEMKQRKTLGSKKLGKHLIQVKQIESKENNQICGKTFRIILYLQPVELTLKKQFIDRQKEERPWSEQQVIFALRSLVQGLIIMHDNSYKNVHLYKEAIFITGTHYKIVDTQLSNRIHPYLELINNVPTKNGTYLAPELLSELAKNNTQFYHSPKADIFTLAVIVLQLLTLQYFDNCFDYQKFTVNIQELRSTVQSIQCSQLLKGILELMLVQQQQERVGLITLRELLIGDLRTSNEDARTYQSISTQNAKKKNTTRTFISRSKPESQSSKNNSLHKLHTENIPKEHLNSHFFGGSSKNQSMKPQSGYFSSQRQPIHAEGQPPLQIQTKRTTIVSRPVYRPIEPIMTQPIVIPQYDTRQTPRSSLQDIGGLTKRLKVKQFQTPVNLLYQPIPQSTPIRKIQILNSHPHKPQSFNNRTYGEHLFSNGARYEGQFGQNGDFDGNGMLYYPNGKLCYSGSWQANSFHGFGVLYNETPSEITQRIYYQHFDLSKQNGWQYYQGQFDNDKKQGFGTLYFSNGDKFSGCFKSDSIEGFGTFYLSKQGRNINGIWEQNVYKR